MKDEEYSRSFIPLHTLFPHPEREGDGLMNDMLPFHIFVFVVLVAVVEKVSFLLKYHC